MRLSIFNVWKIIVFVAVGILTFDALSIMLLGSLGNTTANSDWNYILLLYIFLGSLGGIATLANLKGGSKISRLLSVIATVLLFMLSFALLGFYYGGSISDKNPQVATATAIASAILGTIFGLKPNQTTIIATTTVASIAAYGFAFYAGTNAIAHFSVLKLEGGILWSIVCLVYLGLTINNCTTVLKRSLA